MMDELEGLDLPQHDETEYRLTKWFALIVCMALLFLVICITLTGGCVTLAKTTYHNAMATPTPTPTPEPTPEPTEAPIIYIPEDKETYMLRTNGLHMREWHHWFRENVQGINGEGTKDLSTWVTVYDYRIMDSYRWWSVSWARKFVVKPDDREDQFLFIFTNTYSDDTGGGTGDDVRQYLFDCSHYHVGIGDRLYKADDFEYPERRITEFDNMYTFDHTVTPGPFGYKIVQEKGSGVISAQKLEWLFGGRSNAVDGYCQFQIPRTIQENATYQRKVTLDDIKVYGTFANLGGTVWWKLE